MAAALRAQLRAVTVGQRACVGQLMLRVVCRLQRLALPALEPLLCRLWLWAGVLGLPPVRCPLCILRITHLPHPTAPPNAVRFRDRSAARVEIRLSMRVNVTAVAERETHRRAGRK